MDDNRLFFPSNPYEIIGRIENDKIQRDALVSFWQTRSDEQLLSSY